MIAQSPGWSFLDPWFFTALAPVWAMFVCRWMRSPAAAPVASVALIDGLPKSLRARLWRLPLVLLALSMTAFTVALARPASRDIVPLREDGVDILLTLDISSSMTAADMDEAGQITRIRASRDCALDFAKARTTDRVGLLTFALYPELRCPLTLDQEALSAFLRSVTTVPRDSPQNMTGIGVALAKSVTLLENSEAKSKVVVLLSDGENNVEEILPAAAAKLAKDAGVSVHCIGLGRGFARRTFFTGIQRLKPEFKALKNIAKIAGGVFHEAESGADLARVYEKIDELEKVELQDPRYRTVDHFLYPFLVGVGLLLLQLLVEFAWIRRLP